MTLSTQLEALAQKMTPGDLSTAERHTTLGLAVRKILKEQSCEG